MKKQNKKVKKNSFLAKLNEWGETPESKYDKKLPEEMMAIRTTEHDLLVSILVVSLFVNLMIFTSWLVIQADPSIRLLLVSLG